jgi:hypothetical protein
MRGRVRIVILGAAAWAAVTGSTVLPGSAQQDPSAAASVPDQIDFNWHVRPILADNCFQCHGPDAKNRRANMRLDVGEDAYAERGAPARPRRPIVPGDSDASEVIRRITAANPAVRMPPQSTHKTLSPAQIDLLRAWIARGAEYKPHWAFITPARPAPPPVASLRVTNEVDRFVLARLQREGLMFSPEADRETLINRVSLTLTGLPPTLAEVDAFVKDARPDAYERLVDRLLGSRAYGEHMAGYWANLARWADTDGFLDDHHDRFLWPWRDWVIGAFNSNMPWNQFSTWQLAGDLLPNPTKEQRLATAFLRVGPRTTENGAIDEEYRVEAVVDKTNTIGVAFLGMTVGCARCHDHKYDVISHRDYYSLAAFFNNADEPGFYPPGHSTVQAGPTLPWPDAATEKQIAAAEATMAKQAAAYEAARKASTGRVVARVDTMLRSSPAEIAAMLRASIDAATVAHYPFEEAIAYGDDNLPEPRPRGIAPASRVQPTRQRNLGGDQQPEGRGRGGPNLPFGYVRDSLMYSPSATSGVANAVLQAPIIKAGVTGNALFFDDTNKGFLAKDVGRFERTQEFSLDLWFYQGQVYEFHPNEQIGRTGKGLPYGVPIIQHRDDDNSGGMGYRLQIEDGHLWVYVAHTRPANMIALRMLDPLPVKAWTHITVTYDGSSRAAGTKLYINGKPSAVDVDHDTLTRSILPLNYNPVVDSFVGFSFGQRMREKPPVASGLDELRLFKRALTPVEVAVLHDSSTAIARTALIEFATATDTQVAEAKARLDEAREAHNKIVTDVPQVLVMADAPRPREAYLLNRGLYSERGERVAAQGLERIYPWNPALPQNRRGLVQWLFDPKHPLTSRVWVNRMWQMHFGQGLVETSENFGVQGSIPTHPELLDWLAVTFVESGWDVKRLHKTIVMSATFRQRSDATDALMEKDPRNLLLARGPRYRMPAEMVRDQALAASGLLRPTVGGPSVYPYQPDGIWNPGVTSHRYPTPDAVPDDHHRRSIYTFIKRNAVNPQLQLFDFPDRNLSTVRRQISNTPLQALELLNDAQFVEAYRMLAAQAIAATPDADGQLTRLFRLATRRRPRAEELSLIRAYYDGEVARYTVAREDAVKLLATGLTRVDAALNPVRLAALTSAAALVMNSPDAYSVR